jgi:hypothetical protein
MIPDPISTMRKPGRFRIGDRVRILYGFRGTEATVVEDLGNIGMGGRRFYTVQWQMDQWNEMTLPYPEEELELVAQSKPSKNSSDKP